MLGADIISHLLGKEITVMANSKKIVAELFKYVNLQTLTTICLTMILVAAEVPPAFSLCILFL